MNNWIKESGTLKFDELRNKLNSYSHVQFIAMYTDRFEADNGIPNIDDKLLELRLFNKTYEFHAFRSNISEDFSYRLSDEINLQKDEYLVNYQKIDSNIEFKNGHSLMTTVGGRYNLPIDGESYVKVIDFINYDEDGMATLADYRIVGFVFKDEVDRKIESSEKREDKQDVR